MKRKSIKSEPCFGGDSAIKHYFEAAEFLRVNRAEQIAKSIVSFREAITAGKLTGITRRTPLQELRRIIKDAARCIRSWHAFGEPSPYGKAICARLREEIICYAAIKRGLEAA